MQGGGPVDAATIAAARAHDDADNGPEARLTGATTSRA